MLSHPPSLCGIGYREYENAANFSPQWLFLLNLQYHHGVIGKPVRSVFTEVKSWVGGRCNQNLPPNLDLSNRTETPHGFKPNIQIFPLIYNCA